MANFYSPTYGADSSSGRTGTNSDLQRLIKQAKERREAKELSQLATQQLADIPGKEVESVQRKRAAAQVLEAANVDEVASKSLMDRITSILDAPAKHVARPLMAGTLANVFRVLPGEQAGEAELRKAAGINPLGFFSSERRERLRGALEETELPFGVYTAMELALDPLNYVPLGYLGKGARALTKVEETLRTGKELTGAQKVVGKITKGSTVLPEVGPAAGKGEIPTPKTKIGVLPSMKNILAQDLTESKVRQVAIKLKWLPVAKQVIGAMSPEVLAQSAEGRAVIAHAQARVYGDNFASAVGAQLMDKANPFQITKHMVRLQDNTEMAWADLFSEGPNAILKRSKGKNATLTSDQAEYIKKYIDILDEVNILLKKEGLDGLIDAEDLTQYIPRIVRSRKDVEDFVRNGKGNSGFFSKKPWNYKRYYDTMQEGLDNGVDYFSPEAVMLQHLRGVYYTVADKRLLNHVVDDLGLGIKKTALITTKGSVSLKAARRTAGRASRYRVPISKSVVALAKKLQSGEKVLPKEIAEIRGAINTRIDDVDLKNELLRHVDEIQGQIGKTTNKVLPKSAKVVNDLVTRLTVNTAKKKGAKATHLEGRASASVAKSRNAFEKEFKDLLNDEDLGALLRNEKNLIPGFFFDAKTRKDLGKSLDPQKANAFIRGMSQANLVARLGLTGFDFGAGMIQGLPLLVKNPRGWVRSQKQALETLLNPEAYSQYIRKHYDTIREMADNGGSLNVDEFVEAYAQNDNLATKTLSKFGKPGEIIDSGSRRAAKAFSAFSLAARIELYESMRPMVLRAASKKAGVPIDRLRMVQKKITDPNNPKNMIDSSITLYDAALQDLVEHVSKMTGVSNQARLGINSARSEWERAFLFAPRYLRATTGLVGDVFQGGMRGTLARDSMAKMLAGGTLMYYGMALAVGQEPKLDPTKGDFLTINVNGTNVGFGSTWVAMARQTGKVLTQVQEDIEGVGDPNEKLISLDPQDGILARYLRTKSSPVIGLGWDTLKGRDMMGQPVPGPLDQPVDFLLDAGSSTMLPIWLQSLIPDELFGGVEMNPDSTFGGKAALLGSEFGGLRAFPSSFFAQRKTRRDALAQVVYDKSWDQLNNTQRKALNDQDEQLKIMDQQVRTYQLDSTDDMRKLQAEYDEKSDGIREEYQGDVSLASKKWENGEIGGKQWRDIIKGIGRDRRTLMRDLNDPGSKYAPALSERREYFERNGSGDIADIAYQDYIQNIIIGAAMDGDPEELMDDFGNVDYDRRRQREQAFNERWGEQVVNAVNVRLSMNQGLDPILSEWQQGLDLFSNYWQVGDNLANQQGLSSQWKEFKENENRAKGDEIKAANPAVGRLVSLVGNIRKEMRRQSPALEAWLLKFGYISSLQNTTTQEYGEAMIEKTSFDPFTLPVS